jgi:hypothetical protein
VLALLSIMFSSSEVDDTPTLKSPSVARITRLFPPLMKLSSAVWYASLMPAAPAVASKWSSTSRMAFLSDPLVEDSTRPSELA